ncbi:MAG: hypothetical protein IPI59_02275 [Sphingobacteriales bacterium]|jgi:hypothetical protein|nr:hypothetical protein [Sphingobacteriales bacterium]MBP9141399.1 hypothetical protein [Chitinophagales bacterium]MDA0197557.1 hypothetical protein [Bacteroidota bacterium]MBK7526391.1 hypothetical protein [Sphingobacteriales bacterium]MBK8680053.1 hypothetical protein [Sphingobacteriales bacterium]
MLRTTAYCLLIGIFIANTIAANAQLFCQNTTNKDIWLSLAYNYVPIEKIGEPDLYDTFVCEGWFYVPAGGAAQLTTHIGFDRKHGVKTNFFFYAYQIGGREWSGSRLFLTDFNAPKKQGQLGFKIENAQKTATNTNPQYWTLNFKRGVNTDMATYVLVLREDDVNDPPHSLEAAFDAENPFDPQTMFGNAHQNESYSNSAPNPANRPSSTAPISIWSSAPQNIDLIQVRQNLKEVESENPR